MGEDTRVTPLANSRRNLPALSMRSNPSENAGVGKENSQNREEVVRTWSVSPLSF